MDVPYANKMGSVRRLVSYMQYAGGAYLKSLKLPPPDIVWGITVPLTTAWAADRLSRKRKVPWVFEVRDLWPEFPIQMGAIRNPTMQRRLRTLEKRLYHSADHIVTLSPDMTDHVVQCGEPEEKVSTLLNGTDFEQIELFGPAELAGLRESYGLGDRKVVLYAGSFGRANDIPTLLDAAARLQQDNQLCFVFLGHGFHEPDIQKASERLPNVVHVPTQSRTGAMAWFKLADLSLISFIDRPILSVNSPTKFYDSLGCATPVVVTNPGWMMRFVEQHDCGWYTPPSDAEALAGCIRTVLADPGALHQAGQKGETVARQLFDRQHLARQMEQILEQTRENTP